MECSKEAYNVQSGLFKIYSISVEEAIYRHTHNFLELCYIQTGWTMHTLNGVQQRLVSGQYLLLDYGECHSYDVVSKDLTVINCLFSPSMIDASLVRCHSLQALLESYLLNISGGDQEALHGNVFTDESGEILQLLNKMQTEFLFKQAGYLQVIRSALIEAIILIIRRTGAIRSAALNKPNNEVCFVLKEVDTDAAFPHSLSDFAERLHIHPSTLSRAFKAAVGVGFSEYLQNKRMELACILLANTDLTVARISEKAGYTDPKFFRELFKKGMGLSPAAYRKRCNSPETSG